MARINDHCKDCKEFLGNEMREVHEFLDQYAAIFPIGAFNGYHRTFLHNAYGLEIVTSRYGQIGKDAAILHLTRDYVGGTIDYMPFETILKEFPKRLLWFNKLESIYKPKAHVVRGWNGKGLVAVAHINL